MIHIKYLAFLSNHPYKISACSLFIMLPLHHEYFLLKILQAANNSLHNKKHGRHGLFSGSSTLLISDKELCALRGYIGPSTRSKNEIRFSPNSSY